MKKHILIVLSITTMLLSACEPSKEERAEELISSCVKDYLPYPNSYEAVSITVDSVFANVITDKESFELCEDLLKHYAKIKTYSYKIERAEQQMNLYSYSQYLRNEYNKAKKKRDENQILLDKLIEKVNEKIASIKERKNQLNQGEFSGWRVSHRYRSADENKKYTPPVEMIFLCDKNFTTCFGYEKDTFEAFEKLIEAIADSENEADFKEYLMDLI